MKHTCRIIPILAACLILAPLLTAAGQPEYPKHFLDVGILQLPGSRVVALRLKDNVPVTVVLESEDTNSGVAVVAFYTLLSKPFTAAWDYDYELTKHYESQGDLEKRDDTVNMLYMNKQSKKHLLIKDSHKGRRGSRVELTYPWRPLTFEERLEKAGVLKKPGKK